MGRGAWLLALAGCGLEPIVGQGQFGAIIPLATGDASLLPRVAFIDEGCPGAAAVGGCPASGDRQCEMLLIDSLAPLSAIRDEAVQPGSARVDQICIEIREAAGLAVPPPAVPSDEDLARAVARFRFDRVPTIRAPSDDTLAWDFTAGDETLSIRPGGVLGGNLLRSFALSIKAPRGRAPHLRVYTEFPGDEDDLADAGRAFLALQFPGRLLGRRIEDRCRVDDDRCELPGFDLLPGQANHALEPTRMVVDACIAAPPCTLQYTGNPDDPFAPGTCELVRSEATGEACADASDTARGGRPASLVLATGVPGIVLFDDSAVRMFGDLDRLPACSEEPDPDTPACREDDPGTLYFPGWRGDASDLLRLKVRSVALVAGVVTPRDVGPCERVDRRQLGLFFQCECWRRDADRTGDIRNTAPPSSAACAPEVDDRLRGDLSERSLVMLGETSLRAEVEGDPGVPDPDRWLVVHVLPATHPLPLTIRRDVSPEAIQPDGLLGAAIFDDTETILDYTDVNPGLRMRCLDASGGACKSMPDCTEDGGTACCFGLPLPLLVDMIVAIGDERCCSALSASELEEVQELGHCQGLGPP